MLARLSLSLACLISLLATGCASTSPDRTSLWRQAQQAADPLLNLDPEANWTECYNRLVDLGPASIDYLTALPEMTRRAAPDALRPALCSSLLRLLANPVRAPRLSLNCYETTLDLLHFHPKVFGHSLGQVCIPPPRIPKSWLDLYPRRFDHLFAQGVDVETDRRIMLIWWRIHRGEGRAAMTLRKLEPKPAYLWPLLSRRLADRWLYEVKPPVILCAGEPGGSALFRGQTCDYNHVRAACIWLGECEKPDVVSRLIDLVGAPSDTAAYNAVFALKFSRNPRIRGLIQNYNSTGEPISPEMPRTKPVENVSI